jgi:hypothetical protein
VSHLVRVIDDGRDPPAQDQSDQTKVPHHDGRPRVQPAFDRLHGLAGGRVIDLQTGPPRSELILVGLQVDVLVLGGVL